ncbi:MAG TPA: methyltransferase domain-containing protein [Gemmatimonadaceae bacterium]|nr:methyltransferase domain-containing protein [Gemmatimonadaceae bacterium]
MLFLGFIPPVNTMFAIGSRAAEQPAYPLELLRCAACSLVQIGLEVDAEILFPKSYPYLSGTTRALRQNFADLRTQTEQKIGLEAGSFVVDIGSNDGTLLANYLNAGYRVLGVEPSQAGDVARRIGIETLSSYFGLGVARQLRASHGGAQLVTAANVFAHIANVHDVVDGVLELLAPRGVFVSESHYLLDLVETIQYDTIYHEHLRHYSLTSLTTLLEGHGLEVFDVTRIPTHGGSLRAYAARRGEREQTPAVAARLADELDSGLVDGSAFHTFCQRVVQSKVDLYQLLAPIKRRGERVYGIGAPSRASTLINYTGLDDGVIDAVMEVSSSHKLNKYIPGTRIPVLDEQALFADQPEYALLLSWHIADELADGLRAKGYRGRFIVPLPEPRVLDVALA